MFGFLEGREGGSYGDLFRPKDQRHLQDTVGACLRAEAPFADTVRAEEAARREAKREYDRINNGASATNATYAETALRIEGGRPVTYFGAMATNRLVPAPPPGGPKQQQQRGGSAAAGRTFIAAYVTDEGLLIDKETPQKPSGRRRPPTAPAAPHSATVGCGARAPIGIAAIGAASAEFTLNSGGPRTYHRSAASCVAGGPSPPPSQGGGAPSSDPIFWDDTARRVPTKAERIRVLKATLPNPAEEAARARADRTARSAASVNVGGASSAGGGGGGGDRTPSASSARLLPQVKTWRRPNYPHPWMRREAYADEAVHTALWRQRAERVQRRQQAAANLTADYGRLRGAALSVSSPRYQLEQRQREEERRAAQRTERREAEWAAKERQFMAERAALEAAEAEANGGVGSRSGKKLSSKMRREIASVFERVSLSPR